MQFLHYRNVHIISKRFSHVIVFPLVILNESVIKKIYLSKNGGRYQKQLILFSWGDDELEFLLKSAKGPIIWRFNFISAK